MVAQKTEIMKIIEQWIVGSEHLVKLEDGTYKIGGTSNIYGYDTIEDSKALKKIKEAPFRVNKK